MHKIIYEHTLDNGSTHRIDLLILTVEHLAHLIVHRGIFTAPNSPESFGIVIANPAVPIEEFVTGLRREMQEALNVPDEDVWTFDLRPDEEGSGGG